MPPYQSAAEKRRQRAIETADAWSAPTMLDGFGQKEKTGVGSRNLANADSLPPRSEVAYSVASSSPRLLPAAPPQLPPLYYQHEPPVNGAGYGYPTPPPVHAYQLPQPSPRPYNVVSIARQPPMPPPPPAQAPVIPNPRQLLANNNSNNLHNYAPMVQVSTAAVFDPNLFGNNTSPSKPPPYANSGYSGAYPVGKPSTHIGPTPYEPHPLEYDGATPPPVAHFAAPSTALEEYYNRTRGPVLSDDDRAAIEDFFATDDFTMQFNAQAAAKRSQQQQQQQNGVMKPPHRVGSLATPRGPAGSDTSGADVKYPVCHKCHADILASANKANKKKQPGANPRAAAVKPGVRGGGGGGGKVFRR